MVKFFNICKSHIKNRLFSGHSRTVKSNKNIIVLLILRGGSVIANLLIVPVTINYVSESKYGIWLTIHSMLTFMAFLDLGLGSGLRNKLTEAIAQKNDKLGRIYVSTVYFILLIFSIAIFLILLPIFYYVNWADVFNTSNEIGNELRVLIKFLVPLFLLNCVLQPFPIVSLANQDGMITGLVGFVNSIFSLLIIYILTKTTTSSLSILSYTMVIIPAISMISFSVYFFKTKYKKYSPSFKFIDINFAKQLWSIGFKFFIINMGSILLFFTSNLIITQLLGPEDVTIYNIVYKYFSVITIISGIVMTPYWVAFNDANTVGEFDWIKKTMKSLIRICFLFGILGIVMFYLSDSVYVLWLRKTLNIPWHLSLIMAAFVIINTFRSPFTSYLNGVGKIQLETYITIIAGVTNIPLSIYLGRHFGIAGVILSISILSLISLILEIIQYQKLIKNRGQGIWNK